MCPVPQRSDCYGRLMAPGVIDSQIEGARGATPSGNYLLESDCVMSMTFCICILHSAGLPLSNATLALDITFCAIEIFDLSVIWATRGWALSIIC